MTTKFSFGSTSKTPAASTGGSKFSFGSTSAAKSTSSQPSTSKFSFSSASKSTTGSTATTTSSTSKPTFSSSLFGKSATSTSTSTATTAAAAAAAAGPTVSLKSKYSELPSDAQSTLASIQNKITAQAAIASDLEHQSSAESKRVRDVQERATLLAEQLATLRTTLRCDGESVRAFKADVAKLALAGDDAQHLATRLQAVDYEPLYNYDTPSPYFWRLLDDYAARMQQYAQNIDEIDRFLADSNSERAFAPDMLRDIMQHQHQLFMTLATRVAALHDAVAQRKDAFVRARKRLLPREHALRPDPFETERRAAIDFFRPSAEQARELALQERAQASEASAAAAAAAAATQTSTGTGTSLFGNKTAATSSSTTGGSGFSFGKSAASTAKPTTGGAGGGSGGGFSFKSAAGTAKPTTGGFSFGKKTDGAAASTAKVSFGSGATAAGGAKPKFSFGAK